MNLNASPATGASAQHYTAALFAHPAQIRAIKRRAANLKLPVSARLTLGSLCDHSDSLGRCFPSQVTPRSHSKKKKTAHTRTHTRSQSTCQKPPYQPSQHRNPSTCQSRIGSPSRCHPSRRRPRSPRWSPHWALCPTLASRDGSGQRSTEPCTQPSARQKPKPAQYNLRLFTLARRPPHLCGSRAGQDKDPLHRSP